MLHRLFEVGRRTRWPPLNMDAHDHRQPSGCLRTSQPPAPALQPERVGGWGFDVVESIGKPTSIHTKLSFVISIECCVFAEFLQCTIIRSQLPALALGVSELYCHVCDFSFKVFSVFNQEIDSFRRYGFNVFANR